MGVALLTLWASCFGIKGQNLMPTSPNVQLGSWSFNDTSWFSDPGYAPLGFTNLNNPSSFDGNALQVDSTNAAWLNYNIVEDDGTTNLTLGRGTIEVWFLPDWNSGAGPGNWGRLIDVGAYTTNASVGWWSLYFSPDGSSLNFSSQTNGAGSNYLSFPISWDTNTWHFIALTYSHFRSDLYIDGQLATNGPGAIFLPGVGASTNGFFVGSDHTGAAQSRGLIDDLTTYNYALGPDEVTNDYAAGLQLITPSGGFHMDDGSPINPGGGSDTNSSGGGSNSEVYNVNYGTNLWIARFGIATNFTVGILSNSQPDVQYEILTTTNLLSQWTSAGFFSGSEITNWTQLFGIPFNPTNNLFLQARSWVDSDGIGIPDWWQLKYFGYVGINPYGNPEGDGWSNLQKYQNGWNPNTFYPPPAPPGVKVSYSAIDGIATISWSPAFGSVTGYTVQDSAGNTYTVSAGTTSYPVSISAAYANSINAETVEAALKVRANYASGTSAWSGNIPIGTSPFSAVIVPGPQGNPQLVVSVLPANAVAIHITALDSFQYSTYGSSNSYITNFDIPVSGLSNGVCTIPNPPITGNDSDFTYADVGITWIGWATFTNGDVSVGAYLATRSFTTPEDSFQSVRLAAPFYDGREQMKENMIFQLRAASIISPFEFYDNYPFGFEFDNSPFAALSGQYSYPTNYAFAGFFQFANAGSDSEYGLCFGRFDPYMPFEENSLFKNFVPTPDAVDPTSGSLTTGVSYDSEPVYLACPPSFEMQTNLTAYPDLLLANDTRWIFYPDNSYDNLSPLVTNTPTDSAIYVNEGIRNFFGLPYVSVYFWCLDFDTGLFTNVVTAGQTFSADYILYSYPETAQPQFQTVEYEFFPNSDLDWNMPDEYYWPYINVPVVPGNPLFSVTNTSPLLITSVGDASFQVASYAKLAMTNGYSGVYGYLGQYFASAHLLGTNGVANTNSTGVLSSYGNFFATEPGLTALVTMPDVDSGECGTGIVHAIALDVDANHDGIMDFSYTSPDQTTPSHPFRFWVNDDNDIGDDIGDGIPGQGTQGDGMRPSLYVDYKAYYKVHGTRDLVDFFPVYVNIGSLFQSNALSAGINYADTNWQFVLSQADGVLRYVTTDLTPTNYLNFLRDTNEAQNLGGASLTTITNVANGGVRLPQSFIASIATNNEGIILLEAAAPTTQPLVLTIYHGTNQIGQTALPLSISGIEQMFRHKNILLTSDPSAVPERLTDTDVPNEPDTSNTNFIFLHGYNVNPQQARGWDADLYKRMYWSGSHAKFYGVTWEGYDSQIPGANVTINLQTNIVHAFNTAPLLNSFLNSLSGTNVVAAHSLGNMVVLSTLNDCSNQTISTYFMIDAAVAIEAIQGNATPDTHLIYPDWLAYTNWLYASDWWKLFPSSDARSTLTWNNRLENLQNANVYNFYSSGEEVLREYTNGVPSSELTASAAQVKYYIENELFNTGLPVGSYTWAWQEMLKGRGIVDGLLSSTHGGWQFSYSPRFQVTNGFGTLVFMSAAQALTLTTNVIQTNSFFNLNSYNYPHPDTALLGTNGNAYAQANRNRIISDAIPCLTLPLGANADTNLDIEFGGTRNYDMQTVENSWPANRPARTAGVTAAGEWHHSDCRQVAYTFTHNLFDDIVTLGGLK